MIEARSASSGDDHATSNPPPITPRSRKRPWQLLLLLAIVILIAVALGAGLHVGAWTGRLMTALRTAGPIWFFVAMAVLPAFGFPLLPFVLAAGPVFAPSLGAPRVLGLALAAVACNTLLAYWLADRALRPLVRRMLARFGYSVPELPGHTAWQAVFLFRLAPGAPFWVQSYLLGLMRVPWLPYVVGSTFVPGCYLAAAIFGGDALMHGHMRSALLVFGLLGLAAAGLQLWRKLRTPTARPAAR